MAHGCTTQASVVLFISRAVGIASGAANWSIVRGGVTGFSNSCVRALVIQALYHDPLVLLLEGYHSIEPS